LSTVVAQQANNLQCTHPEVCYNGLACPRKTAHCHGGIWNPSNRRFYGPHKSVLHHNIFTQLTCVQTHKRATIMQHVGDETQKLNM